MDEKIIWGLVGVLATIVGNLVSNLVLKKREFKLSWKRLQMENIQNLYGLVVELNEQNRKLFKGSIDPNHEKLRSRLAKWLEAYTGTRIFFLKHQIFLSENTRKSLTQSINELHVLAIKIMLERNALDKLESEAGGYKNNMYGDQESEFSQIKISLDHLSKDGKLEDIFNNIELIISNLYTEFRELVR